MTSYRNYTNGATLPSLAIPMNEPFPAAGTAGAPSK